MNTEIPEVYLAWTTLATQEEANQLAQGAVTEKLAACAQVSGPIQSWYRWKGEVMNDTEYRVVFKLNFRTLEKLGAWIKTNHSYDLPQWVVVRAETFSEEYAKWVDENIEKFP